MPNSDFQIDSLEFIRSLSPMLQEIATANHAGVYRRYGRCVVEVSSANDYNFMVSRFDELEQSLSAFLGKRSKFIAVLQTTRLKQKDILIRVTKKTLPKIHERRIKRFKLKKKVRS